MRRFLAFLTLLAIPVLGLAWPAPMAHAAGEEYFFDEYAVLTAGEETEINERLTQISTDYDFDVVGATVGDLGSKTAHLYAADFYEEKGFGADGCILLVSPVERDWAFACTGTGQEAFNAAGREALQSYFLPELADDQWYEAFMHWADGMEEFLKLYEAGTPYGEDEDQSQYEYDYQGEQDYPGGGYYYPGTDPGSGELDKETLTVGGYTIGGILAAIIAIAIPSSWRRKLKSVRPASGARSYVGGFQLLSQSDVMVDRNLVRTPRPKPSDNNNHFMHGGGGGGFSGGFSSSGGGGWSGSSGKF
jgi:uncharacterized membrane protein YgcG